MARRVHPAAVPATMSRELPTPLTVLTYQAVCTLAPQPADSTARVATLGGDLLSLLHPNGRR